MPWWGAGTCILVTVRVLLYRFVLTSWGIGVCVFTTWRRVCQNFGCGAFIYGVVPVTVTTITWSGACVCLNLFTNVGFCGPWITVTPILC